jgi:DNA polymerase III delta subunit
MWHRSKRMFTKIAEQCGQDELNAIVRGALRFETTIKTLTVQV